MTVLQRLRKAAPTMREQGPERPTLILIATLLAFESMLYSIVTPLLPHYKHVFSASKPAIGLLVGAYPAGMIPGALLGAAIATRAGVRRTTLVALMIFALSITPFGFASNLLTLDLLRFVQGAACGCIWSGGLTWVIAIAPRHRRGEVLGSVMATVIFGTLVGPVLGTLAVAVGTEIVFSCVGALAVALALWTLQYAEPPPPEPGTRRPLRGLLTSPRLMLGVWLVVLDALTFGAIATLIPLRLSALGASGVAIGVTFVLGSLLSTFVAPLVGRAVDRRGPGGPLAVGLAATAVLIAVMPLPGSALALAVLCVLTVGGPATASMLPAMAVITDSAERAGIALAFATLLLNLAWATGEMFGAPLATGLAAATTDVVPLMLMALLMLVTLTAVRRARLPRGAPAEHGAQAARSDETEHPAVEHVPAASA
jgi:predicted MFS family arabinose efflux permease